eukprot:gene51898-69455_t
MSDDSYILKRNWTTGGLIYVASKDFPTFLNIFLDLPKHTSIVLISGLEDMGSPWELWHPNRSEFEVVWSHGPRPTISLKEFILDPRLSRWYTQNYDLVGCSPYGCSDISPWTEDNNNILSKVFPLPIGIDFHSYAGKGDMNTAAAKMSICRQVAELESISAQSLPFRLRPLSALAAFDCSFSDSIRYYVLTRRRL